MNTQHTPAPWSVEVDHSNNAPEFIRAYTDGEMHDLASVLCDETGNAAANARLIAAAPDLLDALRAILTDASEDISGLPRDEALDLLSAIADTACAAIAKATGGEA